MFAMVPDWFHRVVAVRRAPPASLSSHAEELRAVLDALQRIDLYFSSWLASDGSGELAPCRPDRDLLPLVQRSRILWAQRGPSDPSHALSVCNEQDGDAYADVRSSFVLDAEEPRISPGLVVELRLGRFIEAVPSRLPVEALCAVLDALVRAFQPDFGFIEPAGTTGAAPARPEKLIVRWLTYRAGPPQNVRLLTSPNAAFAMSELGTGYLATPDLARAGESASSQKQALAQLEAALDGSVPDPSARAAEPAPAPAPARPPPAPTHPVVTPATPTYLSGVFAMPPESRPETLPPSSAPLSPPRAATITPDALRAATGAIRALPFAPAAPSRTLSSFPRPETVAPASARPLFPRPEPLSRAPLWPSSPLAETVSLPDGVPANAKPRATPPPPSPQPAPAPPPPSGMTLEQYASLCAEMAAYPSKTAEIATRYRIRDEATWNALHDTWQTWLARDFATWQRWRALVAEYRTWLHQRGAT